MNAEKPRRSVGRPTTVVLDRDKIARAAIDLIQEEGYPAFTMHRLARHLGVSPSALYYHIDGKQAVLGAMRDLIAERLDVSQFGVKPWDEALVVWARSYRLAFATHPETILLLTTRPIAESDVVLSVYEKVVVAMLEAGWPEDILLATMVGFESFIIGSALDSLAPSDMYSPGRSAKKFPTYARIVAMRTTVIPGMRDAEDAFEQGLSVYLDGLRTKLAKIQSRELVS